MSRKYIFIIIFYFLCISSFSSYSQTVRGSNSRLIVKISNSEIRDSNSKKIGTIYSDGVVRDSKGIKLGTIRYDTVVNTNGATIFIYDKNGTMRDINGRMLYRIGNNSIRDSSGRLIMKYEDVPLTHIIGYICFFK